MVSPENGAVARALAGVRGVGEAGDGLVRVTVEEGQPSELSIRPDAMRLTNTELADHILAALQQAFADASRQVTQALAAELGDLRGGGSGMARAQQEIERMSGEVSQQLDDVYRRLGRLMGDVR